jgi:hypothetical protein
MVHMNQFADRAHPAAIPISFEHSFTLAAETGF